MFNVSVYQCISGYNNNNNNNALTITPPESCSGPLPTTQPQPQPQLQPPHDDSFLLLVRSMIQEQINQQMTPSTLQIPTYYTPQQMFPVM